MSASATATVSLTGVIGSGNGLTPSIRPPAVSSIPAADPFVQNVQAIGTSAGEALVVGDIGTGGVLCAWNMDSTNYIQLSMASDMSNPFAKLLAGESLLMPVASKVIYAQANTGACNLAYLMMSR